MQYSVFIQCQYPVEYPLLVCYNRSYKKDSILFENVLKEKQKISVPIEPSAAKDSKAPSLEELRRLPGVN